MYTAINYYKPMLPFKLNLQIGKNKLYAQLQSCQSVISILVINTLVSYKLR